MKDSSDGSEERWEEYVWNNSRRTELVRQGSGSKGWKESVLISIVLEAWLIRQGV